MFPVKSLDVGENLFDIDAVLVVLCGKVGLLKRTVDALLNHHVLRFTQGRGAARLFEFFRGGEGLTAGDVQVLGLLFPLRLSMIEIVEI